MVDVRVLFWSITNKIYWEKILPITLYVHKITLPENVTLTYTLSYSMEKGEPKKEDLSPKHYKLEQYIDQSFMKLLRVGTRMLCKAPSCFMNMAQCRWSHRCS